MPKAGKPMELEDQETDMVRGGAATKDGFASEGGLGGTRRTIERKPDSSDFTATVDATGPAKPQ